MVWKIKGTADSAKDLFHLFGVLCFEDSLLCKIDLAVMVTNGMGSHVKENDTFIIQIKGHSWCVLTYKWILAIMYRITTL